MTDSVPIGVPADEEDLAALYDGTDPTEFVAMDLPGHVLWDNGMYVEVRVHLGLGRWWAADTDEGWTALSSEARAEYVQRTGWEFPAPGERRKTLRERFPGGGNA